MGALANATTLRADATFQTWVETAIVYVARNVLIDDSAAPTADQPIRKKLALDAAVSPQSFTSIFSMAIACDPSIAVTYSAAEPALETPIINGVTNIWTAIAKITYPNG